MSEQNKQKNRNAQQHRLGLLLISEDCRRRNRHRRAMVRSIWNGGLTTGLYR
jgi:hypothetical protein